MSFSRYPMYKSSAIHLFGQIPQHWEATRLKNAATVRVSTVDKHVLEDEIPVSVCHYVQAYYNRRISRAIAFIEGSAKPDELIAFTLRTNDVVITKDSETPEDIAVAALVVEDIPNLVCGYHLAILRPHENQLDGTYLYYLQESKPLRAYYTVTARGVTRYGLPYDGIANTPILLPPFTEQRAIAAFLDAETARIDTLIARQEALITTLQEKRRALISHVVTKGLDPAAPMRDSGVAWLGAVPAHWEVKRLRFACSEIFLGLTSKVDYVENEGFPLVRASNITNGFLDFSDVRHISARQHKELTKYRRAMRGDVLLSKSGSIGVAALVETDEEFSIYESIFALRPKQGELLPFYLLNLMRSEACQSQYQKSLTGMGVTHLNMSDIVDITIAIPSIDEQESISLYLNNKLLHIDNLANKAQSFIELLHEHRTALIAAAMTGQIDVRGYVGSATDRQEVSAYI